ncbi:MAG TPA: hypothetical protein PKM72_00880 [Nitrospirales bacterium]|nr:hypothetical protein [Nitrospirales bacterium]
MSQKLGNVMMHHSNRVTKVLFVAEDVSDHITDHHVSLRKKNRDFDNYAT